MTVDMEPGASGDGTGDRLYFRQLLAGHDIAASDPMPARWSTSST